MADFCKQCATELFGKDYKEFADLTSPAEWQRGRAVAVLCEGCGPIQVDPDGACASSDCLKPGHAVAWANYKE